LTVTDEEAATRLIEPNVERRGRDTPRASSARATDEVIARIRAAEAILVFGPGEARGELKARLERGELGARVGRKRQVGHSDRPKGSTTEGRDAAVNLVVNVRVMRIAVAEAKSRRRMDAKGADGGARP